MKKIVFLLLLLVLAGCTFQVEEEEIIGCPLSFKCSSGSSGVELEVKDPLQGDEYRVGETFTPWFRVIDQGESDVEGEVCIAGLDYDAFSGFADCQCQDYYIVVQEEEEYYTNNWDLEFMPGYKIIKHVDEQYLVFVNRYEYYTYGIVDVCIKEDPRMDTEGCNPSGEILDVSSSAPLEITSVVQDLGSAGKGSVNLEIDFEVKEKGDGNVAPYESLYGGECVYSGKEEPLVYATFVLFGDRYPCDDAVQLKDGEGKGKCVITDLLTSGSQGLIFEGEETTKAYLELVYVWEYADSVNLLIE